MKRLLLIPTRLHPSRYDFYNTSDKECFGLNCLYEMLQDKLGFEIIYTNTVGNFPVDTEAVFCVFRRPMKFVGGISSNTKFIITIGDTHGDHKKYAREHLQFLQRADVILNSTDVAFRQNFPEFIGKYIFFPNFFKTHERYVGLGYNESPKMKCLLAGRMERNNYPLRVWLRNKISSGANPRTQEMIDVLKHFWYDRNRSQLYSWEVPPAAGDEYAKLIYKYFCATAFSGKYYGMIAKCVEIPAAGSLLLTNEVSDMETAGFVPYEHYVPVLKETLLQTIEDCLDNPEKYEAIRRNGCEFVRANHSISNRFEVVKDILESI